MHISSFEECEQLVHRKQALTEISYTNLELKSSWKQDDGKKVSGLANRVSESIYFLVVGIDDKGAYLNKDESWAKQTEDSISQHFNRYLDPSFACAKVACIKCVDSTYVVIIQIISPRVLVLWNNKAYKMTGTTALEMTPIESMELTVRFNNRLDYSSIDRASTLDADLVDQFLTRIRASTTPAFAVFSELTNDECLGRLKVLNKNCADILFGSIACRLVLYNADESVHNQETLIGLYRLLNGELLSKIADFLQLKFGTSATELYPEDVFKEAVANAVAHAAYFEQDGDLIIEVYQTRLVIGNLCLPESGYFANRWFSRSHRSVNNLLMEALRVAKHVDELGRGKYLIYSQSIAHGKQPPEVIIETAGRYNRWKLILHASVLDEKNRKALDAIRQRYGDTEKSQIAFSLVLWQHKSVEEIKQYIDGETQKRFLEIIQDVNGPIYYYKEQNRFILNRWIKILIEDGTASKALTAGEEKWLFNIAFNLSVKYEGGIITPKRLRELGELGNSRSAKTQCSVLLQKWRNEGRIVPDQKRGVYRFVESEDDEDAIDHASDGIAAALAIPADES